jgi:adenosylcobinamide hydrolase
LEYRSLFSGLRFAVGPSSVCVRSEQPLRVLSSAPVRGGWCEATDIVNRRVPADYCEPDPQRDTVRWLIRHGFEPEKAVALMTAARTEDAACVRVEGDGFCLAALVTAGVGNAVRAGNAGISDDDRWRPGTINTILLVDGHVTESAMAGALVTATEAKAAALQDLEVTDPQGNVATGTSTDAVVIARLHRAGGPIHLYAGTVSPLGIAVARAVYDAVAEAVLREKAREVGKDES